jgi:hypothetical protein
MYPPPSVRAGLKARATKGSPGAAITGSANWIWT